MPLTQTQYIELVRAFTNICVSQEGSPSVRVDFLLKVDNESNATINEIFGDELNPKERIVDLSKITDSLRKLPVMTREGLEACDNHIREVTNLPNYLNRYRKLGRPQDPIHLLVEFAEELNQTVVFINKKMRALSELKGAYNTMVEHIEDGNTVLTDHLIDGISCLDAQIVAKGLYDTRKNLWQLCKRFLDLHMKDCPAPLLQVLIPGVEEKDTEDFNEVISIKTDDFMNLFVIRQPTLISPNQMTGFDSLIKESELHNK